MIIMKFAEKFIQKIIPLCGVRQLMQFFGDVTRSYF